MLLCCPSPYLEQAVHLPLTPFSRWRSFLHFLPIFPLSLFISLFFLFSPGPAVLPSISCQVYKFLSSVTPWMSGLSPHSSDFCPLEGTRNNRRVSEFFFFRWEKGKDGRLRFQPAANVLWSKVSELKHTPTMRIIWFWRTPCIIHKQLKAFFLIHLWSYFFLHSEYI